MIIPFRGTSGHTLLLNRAKVAFLVTLGLCIASYFTLDPLLALFFAQIPLILTKLCSTFTYLIDPKFSFILWPLLYFYFRCVAKQSKLAQWALLLIVAIPLANSAAEILKWLFGRARPELLLTQNLYQFTFFNPENEFHAFPSGHATTSGALAGVFSCIKPQWTIGFLAGGFILALTRVVLNEHFLSDVISGLLLGALIAQWTYRKLN